MINREVIYERNITGSYMKIPISMGNEFDERMMLRKKIPGLLAVERCYINGVGQYWYNISGKQSLDTFCRMQAVGFDFVEKIIMSICEEIEILEWNLLNQDCLLLDPEQIFVSSQTQEIIFAVYPDNHETISEGFRQLMEYLITKIDHKDMEAVHSGYRIYEKTMEESYCIFDIRDEILHRRNMKAQEEACVVREESISYGAPREEEIMEEESSNSVFQKIVAIFEEWKKELRKSSLLKNKNMNSSMKEEAYDTMVYPNELEEEPVIEIHPTICMTSYTSLLDGKLIYQGNEDLKDIVLEKDVTRIGKAKDCEGRIARDTISRYHAKIDRNENSYYIEDLNSMNGTFVNDEMLSYKERRKLNKNDIVRIADVSYRVV